MSERIAHPSPQPASMPAIGSYVADTGMKTARLGRVMAYEGELVFLRPPGGGVEWTARPEDVRPPTESERAHPHPHHARAPAGETVTSESAWIATIAVLVARL